MDPFLFAWKAARFAPRSVIRGIAHGAAWWAWKARKKPAVRLEANLERVLGLEAGGAREVAKRGMASVARYYAEVFEVRSITPAVIDARVRVEGEVPAMDPAGATIAVLGHLGNWDLVGAYAAQHIIPITAVAEVLKPREVFDEFVAMRDKLGIKVLGHEGGSTFRELIRIAKNEHTLVCLLSDRDISGSGVEVTMWGQRVKVAPGPAALSLVTGVPVVPVMVRYERLTGARRRAAKSAWGTVFSFGQVLQPANFVGDDKVTAMSQAWASQLADFIAAHPEDWHMLQRFGWVEST